MDRKMPVGVEDFRKLREGGYYFVDKTAFIRELLDTHGAVTLITRPRRFGKTLTLSMLDYFFSVEKKSAAPLFAGLAIDKAGEKYRQEQGVRPVLFLSLKDIKQTSWPAMLSFAKKIIGNYFVNHAYLLRSEKVPQPLKDQFVRIMNQESDQGDIELSLSLLMNMMNYYYGKPVILLLDEYDTPIQCAWENGFYDDCISFIRAFLGSALKTNPYLDFAVLTGVLRIAKESIFSGLNNLEVSTVTGTEYADAFGFTEEEVSRMAEDLGHTDKLSEIRQWYDGYNFGGRAMYNPWSVISYFKNRCEPMPYWVNTSSNDILRKLLARASEERIGQIQDLLSGKSVNVTLNENVIYKDIGRDKSALFTMLLTTGYLTVAARSKAAYNRFALRIPNEEVRMVYSIEILNHLARGIDRDTFDTLFDALLDGDARAFGRGLSDILLHVASAFDTAGKEVFYHGFLLGMTALFLGKDYEVKSNRESGYGRYDLAILPKDTSQAGVLMEFKVAETESQLETRAEEALRQIEEKKYTAEFTERGIHTIWKYGIAFCGKQVKVLVAGK